MRRDELYIPCTGDTQQDTVVHVRKLEDMYEAIWYMEHAEQQQQISGLPASSLSTKKPNWYGTATMQEAINLARFGWEEGRRTLLRQIGRVAIDELVGQRLTFESVSAYSGDEVDIDAFLMGKPDHMLEYPLRYETGGKQATVFMNCSVPSYIPAEYIMWRGAAVLVAIEALRAEGYSLGLTMIETSSGKADYDSVDHDHAEPDNQRTIVEYHIPVVRHGGFLDMDKAAFCVANPSFLRRLCFSLAEHESIDLRKTMGFHKAGTYGRPEKVASELPPHSFVVDYDDEFKMVGRSKLMDLLIGSRVSGSTGTLSEKGGLDNDEDLQRFAQKIVDRVMAALKL